MALFELCTDALDEIIFMTRSLVSSRLCLFNLVPASLIIPYDMPSLVPGVLLSRVR